MLGPDHITLARWLSKWAGLLDEQVRDLVKPFLQQDSWGWYLVPMTSVDLQVSNAKRTRHCQQGKSKAADVLYVRAINIGDKTLHPDHPDLVDWLNSRTILLEEQVGIKDLPQASAWRCLLEAALTLNKRYLIMVSHPCITVFAGQLPRCGPSVPPLDRGRRENWRS